MITGVYAIRDRLTGYLDVKLIQNDTAAMRDFSFMCSESNAYVHFNKDDYSIYKIGSFDTATGDLTSEDPELIMRGSDLVAEE